MSDPGRSPVGAVVAGALLGARAGAIYAAIEIAAMALVPRLAPSAAAPLAVPLPPLGAGLLAATWIALAAAAGAAVAPLSARLRGSDERLAALTMLPVVLGSAAHAIAYSGPQPRLAFVLIGSALAAALLVAVSLSARMGDRLRFAANPWTLAAILVALAVCELDRLRHAPVEEQALAALVVVAAGGFFAWGAARAAARIAGRPLPAPRPARSLAAALIAVGSSLGSVAWAGRPDPPVLEAPVAKQGARLPPVVLVTLDTVRSDHLSVYGYERETTPHLDAFARRATLHRRAIASSDLTLSTHASLFTGLYTRQHGARVHFGAGATGVAPGRPMLAELLRERGYLTLAVVANSAYLGARYGFDRGFDHYDDRRPPQVLPDPRPHFVSRSLVRGLRALGIGDDPFGSAKTAYRRAGEINREVFALLDRPELRGRPFFLFVNYMDAHWPYDPPPPFDRRFPGRIERADERPDRDTLVATRTLERPLSDLDRLHMLSQYDGGIAYVDEQVGALLARLDERGLLDASLVVITSDHGEAFGEHGLVAHGVSVYQDQVHVPLLVKLPGQTEPEVSDRLASSIDLLPTVLDLVDGDGLPALPGESWAGQRRGDRVVIAESHPDSELYRASSRFRRVQRAIFSGDHKLIVPAPGRPALYDLVRDPGEKRPLRGPDTAEHPLAKALDDWMRARVATEGETVPVDDATAEQLRALGYAR